MADISVIKTQVNPVNNPVTQIQTGNRQNIKAVDTPEVDKEESKASEERKEKLREELLENVVSVSEDGDTVQVSDDGADKLSNAEDIKDIYEEEIPISEDKPDSYYVEMTSSITQNNENVDVDQTGLDAKTDDSNVKNIYIDSDASFIDNTALNDDNDSEDVDAVNGDTSDKASNITSLNSYTDTQLEQMYLKGEISKYNYDQEMNAREAEREDQQNNNEDTSKQVMATVNGMERVAQDAAQLQQAFAEDTVTTPDAAQRVEILSTLQDFTKLQ